MINQEAISVDYEFVTEQIEKEWTSWNHRQRSIWCMFHDLPICPYHVFDDLPMQVRDALFCEYLDHASKEA